MADLTWIERGLAQPGKTKAGLARALGIWPSAVSAMLRGNRRLQLDEVVKAADYLEVDPPLPGNGTVPVVGYVGAGDKAHFYESSQGPFDEAEAPEESTAATVAVVVRGHSMPGIAEEGWTLYYDDRRDPPTDDMIGRKGPVVVGLADGRVLVKRLMRGSGPGLFHLVSTHPDEPPIVDARVEWAAKVRWIKPDW